MFPKDALPPLLDEYSIGDPVTKSNIIRVMGKMAGGSDIGNHLIAALDDKTFCEDFDEKKVSYLFYVDYS